MKGNEKQLAIAEKYLDQMIAADAARDYDAWLAPYDSNHPDSNFTKEYFEGDADEMLVEMGEYQSRVYLGCVKGDNKKLEGCLRFIWKGVYEKKEAIIVVGIHTRDGEWYANEGMWH